MNERDASLDMLRVLGILVIMIAHAEPPVWLDQLRDFGTPLLVVASGATYATIYRNRALAALPFLKKRIGRLVFSAWIFLLFFFSFFYLAAVVMGKVYPFDFATILMSFSLSGGIGYLWILNIFVFLALITPVALRFGRSACPDFFYYSLLVVIYVLYELMLRASRPYVPEHLVRFMNIVGFAYVPYALLFLYGIRLGGLSNKQVGIACLLSFFVFAGIAVDTWRESGAFVRTELFKYPPTHYYFSYAFFALNAAFLICREYYRDGRSEIIRWFSAHSLWIYLWHILAAYVLGFLIGTFSRDLFASLFRAVILLGFGVGLTYLQTVVVGKTVAKSKNVFLHRISALLV